MINLIILITLFSLNSWADEAQLLGQIEGNINRSLEEKIQLSLEKKELQKQISELQIKIKERKVTILNRLRALSRLKKFQWGELLLNANLNDLNRNLKILKNLNAYDLELFKEYRLSFKMLSVARNNLSETESQIENNIRLYKNQEIEFKKLEDIRIKFLQSQNSNSFLLSKGKLTRPLDSSPTQRFGNLRDQHGQYYLVNYGELYDVRKLQKIKSVGLGVVIFRDELTHWRETLIVQHDDDYYSVYAGLTDLNKQVGDTVLANEVIGATTGNEFYFELRHFANAIDPQKWYEERK